MYHVDDLMREIRNDPSSFSVKKIEELTQGDPWLRNCALNTYEYIIQADTVHSYPLDVVLPMTCWCNANCQFCRYCENQYSYLSLDDLNKYDILLKYVKNFGFSSYGEPLLHPDFASFAQLVYGKLDPRATTYLVTNGLLLYKHLNVVKKYCNSVSISLNAATSQTHSKILRLKKDEFINVLNSIKNLVEYRDLYNNKFLIQLSFVVVKDNIHEIPEFIRLAQKLRVNKIYFNTLNLSYLSDFTPKIRITAKEYSDIHPSKHPHFNKLYERAVTAIKNAKVSITASPQSWQSSSLYNNEFTVSEEFDTLKTVHCSYLYQRLLIADPERIMRTCCFMVHPDGFEKVRYVDSESFMEKWNSKGMRAMRKAFARKKLPQICKVCTLYEKNIFK